MDKKIKETLKNARIEVEKQRKDRKEWQALEEKVSKQKIEEVQETLKRLADLCSGFWARWKKLKSITPKIVYNEWWKENHNKPIQEALEKLELKVKGKECRAKDCSNIFAPKRSDQVYCGVNCRTRAYHQRKRKSLRISKA